MKKSRPTATEIITDRAVIRYLELVKGLDIAAVRTEMLADGRMDMVKNLRNCKIPLGDGLRLVVADGVVVTVVPKLQPC